MIAGVARGVLTRIHVQFDCASRGVDGDRACGYSEPGRYGERLLGVQISGQNAQVVYAGPAPGQVAGVSQINFRVPQLPAGTYAVYIGWGQPTNGRPFFPDYNTISLTVGQP